MKVHQFLEHYRLAENPFAHEDAKDDDIFRRHLIDGTHHPAWDKIFGPVDHPSTSVVFGEQGSGKTALRLQMVDQINRHNASATTDKVLVVEYDDLDPFLDTLRNNVGRAGKTPEKTLKALQLPDHMDAILSLATGQLLELLTTEGAVSAAQVEALTPHQRRDIALLAALYDRSLDQSPRSRWAKIRKAVGFSTWRTWWDLLLGLLVTLAVFGGVLANPDWRDDRRWWIGAAVIAAIAWTPFGLHRVRLWWRARRVAKRIRVLDKRPGDLRRIFARFTRDELMTQPLPVSDSADPRYDLFHKLTGVLKTLGYSTVLVIIDRVDEPHLVSGHSERIRDVLWPLLDHKFLSTDDVAFKMLLPQDVTDFLDRESADFHQRSRLDKRNLVKSLEWTGQSLYDITNDRLRACTKQGETPPTIDEFFDESITRDMLIDRFERLRLPRHLFKFFYRLLVEHCSQYTEAEPDFTISRDTLKAQMTLFEEKLGAYLRGRGAG